MQYDDTLLRVMRSVIMAMKTIAEEKIDVPESVNITIEWPVIRVKGPKGETKKEFKGPMLRHLHVGKEGNAVVIKQTSARRKVNALFGSVNAHIQNLIEGVTNGYTYKMKIFYTHFPITMEVKNDRVIVKNFLGERTIRKSCIIGKTKVENKKDEIIVTGIDKEDTAQTAANIENSCRLSRKDRRVFLDGIYITEKAKVK